MAKTTAKAQLNQLYLDGQVTLVCTLDSPAWFAWLFLHLFYLLGGRNKIGTIADSMWNYFTFDRGNRHIMDSV